MAEQDDRPDDDAASARRRDRVPVNLPAHEPTQAFPRVAPPDVPKAIRPPVPRVPGAGATQATQRIEVGEPQRPRVESAPPPRRGRWRKPVNVALLTIAALLAVGAAIVVGTRANDRPKLDDGTGGVATDTPDAKHPPQKDVSLDGCRLDATGVAVDGEVRNPTDDLADYVIEVHLVGPDGVTITSADVVAQDVAPGTRVPWSGMLPAVRSNAPSGTCKLIRVDRHPA